jgi:hypothetical protein
MGDRQWFVLYVLLCLEVGVFLLLVPWSVIWERNYFLQAYPGLSGVVLHPSFRGAVSGLGFANIYLGLGEVLGRRTGDLETATAHEHRLDLARPREPEPESLVANEKGS